MRRNEASPGCRSCGASRPENAWHKGWRGPHCNCCRRRGGAPPVPRPRFTGPRLARLEDYAELRSWGEPMRAAAGRLGVSFRTVQRYEAALKESAEWPGTEVAAA